MVCWIFFICLGISGSFNVKVDFLLGVEVMLIVLFIVLVSVFEIVSLSLFLLMFWCVVLSCSNGANMWLSLVLVIFWLVLIILIWIWFL